MSDGLLKRFRSRSEYSSKLGEYTVPDGSSLCVPCYSRLKFSRTESRINILKNCEIDVKDADKHIAMTHKMDPTFEYLKSKEELELFDSEEKFVCIGKLWLQKDFASKQQVLATQFQA